MKRLLERLFLSLFPPRQPESELIDMVYNAGRLTGIQEAALIYNEEDDKRSRIARAGIAKYLDERHSDIVMSSGIYWGVVHIRKCPLQVAVEILPALENAQRRGG